MPSASASGPIDASELAGLFAPLAGADRLALAVSGGADSLALMVLAARWCRTQSNPPHITVLTVDHGLRPSSAAEAEFVVNTAADYGLDAERLVWAGPRPRTGVEAAARTARYGLLLAAVRRLGAGYLLVGHHRDDQAETFLLRLAGGSGLDGLAGMRPSVDADGVRVVRPFLMVAKARLAATVAAEGLEPVEDESNRDRRYARARLRQLMPALERDGLGSARLAAAARRLSRASDALDALTGRLIATRVTIDRVAAAHIDWPAIANEPEELRLRVLARLIYGLGGAQPRLERLERLDRALASASGSRRTLGGVVFEPQRDRLVAYREIGRAGLPTLRAGFRFDGEWDGRFQVSVQADGSADLAITALAATDWRVPEEKAGRYHPEAVKALPALVRNGEVLAVPALGLSAADGAGITVLSRCIVPARLADPRRFPGFAAGLPAGRSEIHHND